MNESHARALDVAAQQSGVLTRSQARAEGLSESSIDRCLANRLFVPISSHVYRIRGAPESAQMAIAAAVLSTGGRASHETAARLLQLGVASPVSPIHVTIVASPQRPRVSRLLVEDSAHSFFRVNVHRYADIDEPRLVVDGIRCVDAARVLIDIAPTLSSENLEAAFERARILGLVSTEALARRFALLGGRGRPGTPKIRELLAHAQPSPLESNLEVKAWRLIRASRLRNPVRQLRVDLPSGRWHRLDFAWPELLLAFETEGFEWHGTRARWKQDRVRTAALERLGWRIVVATWDDVVLRSRGTLERIAMVIAERSTSIGRPTPDSEGKRPMESSR
jgi:very-short-patch-repair endonuclease